MFASRIALAVLLALPLALPSAALARSADDEVVTTAAARASRPPTEAELVQAQADAKAKAEANRVAKPISTEDQVAAWLANAPPVEGGPIGYAPRSLSDLGVDVNGYPLDKDGKRQIHGEVGVSVGTGGYRSGYVSSLIPIGESSTLGIAIGQTDFGKHGGYGYDGYGYGHGVYGYGPRGGSSQSLALSLDVRGGSGRNRPDTPEGCAPGFRDGDRYIEPVWVTQMRGDRSCSAAMPEHP